jgi:NADH-quinone oxidoreductase subunit N
VRVDSWTRCLSIILVVLMVYIGIFPDQFVAITEAAAKSLP